MESVQALLRNMGLTEYEIKAWMTLIRNGSLTAEKISELGSIPLPRVYDTITELQKKGFVLVTKTRPKVFKSLAPETALRQFFEIKERECLMRLENMKKSRDEIIKTVSKIQSVKPDTTGPGHMWFTEKKENIARLLEDQVRIGKKVICTFSGDLSWLDDSEYVLREAVKKGLKVKILVNNYKKSKAVKKRIAKAKRIGVQVKSGYRGLLRGQMIDKRLAYLEINYNILSPNSHKEKLDKGKYEVVILDAPCIVDALNQYFEFWWKKLS